MADLGARLKAKQDKQDKQDAETARQQEKLEQEVRDGTRWEIPAAAGEGVLLVDPDHVEHEQVDGEFNEDG